MDDNSGSEYASRRSSASDSLDMSCSSSPFDYFESNDEEARLGVHPYQFEPYQTNAEEGSGDEQEGLIEGEQQPGHADRLLSREWCQCQNCQIMLTARECLCCREVPQVLEVMGEIPNIACIVNHPGFQTVCLDVYVLRTAYYSYRQHYREEMEDSPERSRHIAYRQFVRWCWGYLGRNNRVIIPACVVNKIRSTFPSDGDYTGFQEE